MAMRAAGGVGVAVRVVDVVDVGGACVVSHVEHVKGGVVLRVAVAVCRATLDILEVDVVGVGR
jgi:hypothetical protein